MDVRFTNTQAETAFATLMGGKTGSGRDIPGQLDREDLHSPVQYRLARLGDELQAINKKIQDAVAKLRKEFAVKDDDGKPVFRKDSSGKEIPGAYEMDPDRWDEFEAEVEALMATENEIKWDPIDAKLLRADKGKKNHIPGGGRTLMGLAPFIDASTLSDGPEATE